ncbi:hypothetical protein HYALB_00000058 [Hymenoscyphus albidus]|uniref:Crossover junction endonuclease MUS81 n=1 Tax=Hymenoscyphus albidus TaxID=595503 RepID=A0A9N9LKS0_9HELO|nr:hypothetical protein HYALB_00000058 [Hymenoscyphus albidus]
MPRNDTECANPLWLSWVKEWYEKESERGIKAVTTYKKAYDSLRACPLRFEHPSQVIQLTGFGPKLCDRLTEKLRKYCEEEGIEMPAIPKKKRKKATSSGGGEEENDEDAPATPAKKPRKTKPYVPAHRSGGYAIILALATLEKGEKTGILKQEIIDIGQEYSASSFTIPNGHYTAWGSMKTLLEKDLVYEKGRPTRKYFLTEEGWDLAERFLKAHNPTKGSTETFVSREKPVGASRPNDSDLSDAETNPSRARQTASRIGAVEEENKGPDLIQMGKEVTSNSDLPKFSPIVLQPGSFVVEMVLDNREVAAKNNRQYMHEQLREKKCPFTVRPLPLGDILWVAKLKDPIYLSKHGMEGDEVVLDYIVERKRLDDLISSIKDGRFYEQKFRLNRSGLKNVVYLIEEGSAGKDSAEVWADRVQSAIATTQVIHGIFLKKTQKVDETIRYLTRLTAMLKEKYEKEPLHLIPTPVVTYWNYLPLLKHLKEEQPGTNYHATYQLFQFYSDKTKNLILRDVFLKMLMCTKGVSGTKALEIQKRWKTPAEFIAAYKACGEGTEGEKKKHSMVSDKCGNLVGNRKIQKAVSTKIAKVWGFTEVEY